MPGFIVPVTQPLLISFVLLYHKIQQISIGFFVKSEYFSNFLKKACEKTSHKTLVPKFTALAKLPSKLKYICHCAFEWCFDLEEVIIPYGVEYIGNFAFDRCVGLETVRFPSDPVTIKEGVFFRCPSIKNVVFGKNWETVDFSHFKWSRSLTEVNIPANASNVKNIKSLPYLQTVNVDKGNTRFASVDGVLYNKRKTILFACPLAYDAELNIASQTKEVYEGALSDCYRLKSVKFPASMDVISPRILIRADSLQSVTFALDTALVRSAKMGDKEVLAIVHPNARNIMVYVPSKLASKYKKVMKWEVMNDLKEIEGENASKEYRGDQLIPKKNVKKIKKVKISKAKPKNKES